MNRRMRRAKARAEKRLGRQVPDERVQVVIPAEDLTRARTGPGARGVKVLGQNRGR